MAYTTNITFSVDGKKQGMEANFEFEGRGIRYAPGKFHLFSVVVDRESVFFEERQFKHSLTGDVAESNE